MSEWTKAAEQAWTDYAARVRAEFGSDAADAEEVIGDLRRHVEEELRAKGMPVVTGEAVREVLQRLGVPGRAMAGEAGPSREAPGVAPPPLASNPKPATAYGLGTTSLLWFGGVLLPAFTLFFELATGGCSGAFFDPLPTWWHVLLVALVPVVNGLTWFALTRQRRSWLRHLGWLNAGAIGVAGFYTLKFLPMLPWGLVGIIIWGLGFLVLSPLLALLAGLLARVRLREMAIGGGQRLNGFGRGFITAVLLLAALSAPTWATRWGLKQAASEDAAEQARGVRWLRIVGNEELLRRECYGRTARSADLDFFDWLLGGRSLSPEQARVLYFRVTGRPFNTLPPPKVRTPRGEFAALADWTWDADQGGEKVGGRLRGLSLHSSRLDAVLEPAFAHAYVEWTLEFSNEAEFAQEARAQVLLPPGGVVSRLTLWVDGEEREAAFGGRAQVKEAYRSVAVVERRDPVLVSTCGPDRVLVQCFPVPPRGGTIKVRIGITAPLVPDGTGAGVFRWPSFLERNFSIPEDRRHAAWATAPVPMKAASPMTASGGSGSMFAIRGELRDPELSALSSLIRLTMPVTAGETVVADPRGNPPGVICQHWVTQEDPAPRRVALVVDRNPAMVEPLAELAEVLEKLGGTNEWAVIVAGDEPLWLSPGPAMGEGALPLAGAAAALRSLDCRGGHDNLPALLSAWDWAAEAGGLVVWIHGALPVELTSPESLRQRLERDGVGTRLVTLPVSHGPNRILERLDGLRRVECAPRIETLGADLRRVLHSRRVKLLRERMPVPTAIEAAGDSLHVARLWAGDEVHRLLAARRQAEAVALATQYQLVTPVTAAVVLETREQFARHGLEPVDATTVPSIPEPSALCLLLMGGLFFLCKSRRQLRVATASVPPG